MIPSTVNTQLRFDQSLLERLGSLVFLLGFIAVFQGRSVALYEVGRGLLVVGALAYLGGLLLKAIGAQPFLERLSVLGMFIGVLGMFQPWNILYYEYGFYLLGICTLAFIIISHLPSDGSRA